MSSSILTGTICSLPVFPGSLAILILAGYVALLALELPDYPASVVLVPNVSLFEVRLVHRARVVLHVHHPARLWTSLQNLQGRRS